MTISNRMGGKILADGLKAQGVELIFGVPGESYLALLDGLYDQRETIRFITCRQEGGAANMAEAYGKLTGQPGICVVTRGPGAANASIGLHTAFQDSTPMLLLVGQVGRQMQDREAFQEVNHGIFFSEMSKWSAEIRDPSRIPEYLNHAFHSALSGRPGPVVLSLPEDMLREEAEVEDAPPAIPVQPAPAPEQIKQIREMLLEAESPLMVLGGGGWNHEACRIHTLFADQQDLPVAVSFRCQDRMDNDHRCYIGDLGIGPNPKLHQLVQDSDLLIVVGARMGEMTTGGYRLMGIPVPNQKLVHIHPGADELGRVYRADLPINASVQQFAQALSQLETVPSEGWRERTAKARQSYEAFQQPPEAPGNVNFADVVRHLSEALPADAIITNGAGIYSSWGHRFYRFHKFPSQLGPTSGAMGYGMPAAISAKLVFPEREVVCLAGDGCFMMNGQEMATAVQYGLNLIVLVINNGMLGTIRMHQEKSYPRRVHGTALHNPDFAALARAYGAFGAKVEKTSDFPDLLAEARKAGRPALLEVVVDPEALTPNASLSEIRNHALKN
ncbi:MAG: thiamine pyrophosphate-binding protein [SAR324 cluster bacterium]|jgi:acetolactate synthase-1/2/3 large subunit|nr:thiamine pyrophosphate-binding protein [Deltaproteobacteria bacterium]MDP6093693.1 thiamine pyrophosphate-binding protein [SAR324 cluster bacterium]MDP7139533.1 thiamine pyrophosphate-binding protein [SAR324 cluster bacterium]MDP7335843.1 thiamine pyrophosphate-binding protein [SAR324 cluster bacterium]MDP7502009.1 thiamine pyrophosphate-binding protein [SAR324 cluster bacterium]|tara:strand:- start:4224 stop:5897 length:1674 start_codon:yes stop_codon:yes gene_type:complete